MPTGAQNLRIATRSSALALWQAEHVRERLQREHVGLDIELIPITTTGDKILDRPLAKIGGKGLFIKELEQALLDERADIAVHSMKDVPVLIPTAFVIPVLLEREDPRDALVSISGAHFSELNTGAIVGTSSLRRKSQLLSRRPDVEIRDLRGNVTTRLEKLRAGEFDAIVLATAGLKRLGYAEQISNTFEVNEVIPAVGQGAIGIECRADDKKTQALIAPLHDHSTGLRVTAERAMSGYLDGGCDVPLAAHATLTNGTLRLTGLVASLDGRRIAQHEVTGALDAGPALGIELGTALEAGGAREILRDVRLT
jgi:hydroxymethylbilane synthase